MSSVTTLLDHIATELFARLPVMSAAEQHLAVELYHQLARGRPVVASQLAAALRMTTEEVTELLGHPTLTPLIYRGSDGGIIGFGGLAVRKMAHRLVLDGQPLYTWCAWDSLFIPVILGSPAQVESHAPEQGARIRLTVTPSGVRAFEPEGTVMSFLLPSAQTFQADALTAMASFCHFIYFFPSPDSAAAWTARHTDTAVLSLSDAFELGRRMVAARYGAALEARAAKP